MAHDYEDVAVRPVVDLVGEGARGAVPCPSSEFGTIMVGFSTSIDGVLFRATGDQGSISLSVDGGHLSGRVGTVAREVVLDAEDAIGVDDGRPHAVALTVDESGTHLFYDGYEVFSATVTAWLSDIGASSVEVDPGGAMQVGWLRAWSAPIASRDVVVETPAVEPMIQFAASELSPRDARRCGELGKGSLRSRVRLRGVGQGGTVLEAQGSRGRLRISIEDGDLVYVVETGAEVAAHVRAQGHWDDGNWHDLVVVSGRGAIDLYVDGFQVAHGPGEAFLADLGDVSKVVVGAGVSGARLFGEAQSAMVYDVVLNDHQVKRLASVSPLPTRALFDTGLLGSRSYRIPSLLALESGVLLAGADQRVSIANDSPNDINFVLRRSTDQGKTWSEPEVLIRYPGEGRLGASVIDSVLLQDRATGRVIVLIDHFPGGVGQPNCCPGTGFSPDGKQILIDRNGTTCFLRADGSVVDEEGADTGYRVNSDGDVEKDGHARGNIYLADGVDPEQSLLTVRTSYLQMIYSDDDGVNWSEPIDITAQVKEPWMRFFGTSPGNGIQIERGPKAGRLVCPVYYNHEEGRTFSCAVVYSDDGGETWLRGASPNDGRQFEGGVISSRDLEDDRASLHESAIVEDEHGVLHAFMRNQHPSGRVAHACSTDGGETWGDVEYVEQLTEIFSQPNAIEMRLPDGRLGVVFANASQMLPFRGCGVLRLSLDGGRTWSHNRVLNPRHHVYQCMAQLNNGSLLVLWEREWQGLYLTEVPLEWLLSSRSTVS
ncbi:sialidase family protein [Actinomyces radicidentis]|uniref:sialidase family protein n=1 Tax=Actinomyces radicidentis TaxID=111015 RepID=UPI0026DFF18D|nr:sialidase family protein [Actinomyces radicidentis]